MIVVILFMHRIGVSDDPMAGKYVVSIHKRPQSAGEYRAVSLKVVQEKLQSGLRSEELLCLGGLTRVEGFVVDSVHQDLILFGIYEEGRPVLRTEDLAIALRNVFRKYAVRKRDTIVYAHPCCSIDLDVEVVQSLKQLADSFSRVKNAASSADGLESFLDKWRKISRKPMSVSVRGVPFNSRFAKVMVDSDYVLKNCVNGTAPLDLEGIPGMRRMVLNEAKKCFYEGESPRVELSTMNRFWFHAGKNRYLEDRGIVRIAHCPVHLSTEEERLDEGEIKGSGKPNPFAQRFAGMFTQHYSSIARRFPLFAELESLFRFVALAEIVKAKKISVDLTYLLEDFPVSEVDVKSVLPGIPHVEHACCRRKTSEGSEVLDMWLPSCGGVSIAIAVTGSNFDQVPGGTLRQQRAAVLKARPTIASAVWPFGNSSGTHWTIPPDRSEKRNSG
jgi:hypothetical protein